MVSKICSQKEKRVAVALPPCAFSYGVRRRARPETSRQGPWQNAHSCAWSVVSHLLCARTQVNASSLTKTGPIFLTVRKDTRARGLLRAHLACQKNKKRKKNKKNTLISLDPRQRTPAKAGTSSPPLPTTKSLPHPSCQRLERQYLTPSRLGEKGASNKKPFTVTPAPSLSPPPCQRSLPIA